MNISCPLFHLPCFVRLLLFGVLVSTIAWPLSAPAADGPTEVTPELRQQAVEVLRRALQEAQQWEKVHAAEFLLALDYSQGVREVFAKELAEHEGTPQYRIGVWRVLARAAVRPQQRKPQVDKIRDVFLDPTAPDRLHAVETLGKLGYKVPNDEDEAFDLAASGADGQMAAYARWVLVTRDEEPGEARLVELLDSDDPAIRQTAAYAVGRLAELSPAGRAKLTAAAAREPSDSPGRVYLIGASAVWAEPEALPPLVDELVQYVRTGTKAQRLAACNALAQVGAPDELPLLVGLLEGLLNHEDTDLRSSAAAAILRIDRRGAHGMSPWDWSIVGVYALGMLAVGLYYSRRTKTTEDYLLGGRKMNPMWVGLSLFATMLSALTYLATPGELIKNGPAFLLGQTVSYPLIALVVGWFLIPFIMKLKITSAYEILETRLGLGVRMLGSTFFLSLRLLWMGAILFATADKVLVPLMGLDHSATPWLCAVLALVTVAYTSMGGLRAVVFTDVVQTFILFGGAILALVLISIHFGGVGGWWPTEWPTNWPALRWGYDSDPEVRTVVSALMASFVWFVCTSGSDQMSIQRYLATKDVRAARTTLILSLAAAALAGIFLSTVGLALLAFFNSNPHLVADGQRVLSDADKLFPRYIAVGLPVGCSGLVMAGLLAASMSSLSSGVNSSCSVIIVDFIDRFRKRKDNELDHVMMAKWISILVGIAIVLLSTVIDMIHGNLLDLCFKTCNLLTAPLFGLFFMAMFVRWATGAGTLVGALFGVVVVFVISFWADLFQEHTGIQGISILWAMPLSLLVQISVGTVASLVIGRRREAEIA